MLQIDDAAMHALSLICNQNKLGGGKRKLSLQLKIQTLFYVLLAQITDYYNF